MGALDKKQKLITAHANYHFENEKIDNKGFIAWKCSGQSSNHVVKSRHLHPLWKHIFRDLVGRDVQFFRFFSKTKGNMHKVPLAKIIPHKIIY